MKKKKVVFITATPLTAKVFLTNYFKVLSAEYEIYLISNFSNNQEFDLNLSYVTEVDIAIKRKICLLSDLFCLCKIYLFLIKNNIDIVHSITPKAGMIGMIAALFARVNVRCHTFTGQVWANYKGFKRNVFIFFDRIISFSATNILVDSQSQKEFLQKHGIVDEDAVVLGKGSVAGVDIQKFKPDIDLRGEMRKLYNIDNEIVFLYLGRINIDKGIKDLISAYDNLLRCGIRNTKLFIVGPEENGCLDGVDIKNIIRVNYTSEPYKYMVLSDVFCLPSYREGFGSVVIEAAACGITSIASNIYGLSDAVVDGETGLLHDVGDVDAIKNAMLKLTKDKKYREKLSEASLGRAVKYFNKDYLCEEFIWFYKGVDTCE
ncbi:MAG: glycosyltransferase [Desulfotalea sp.]